MKQKYIEAMYSQRNIHTVLHESIREQLDKLFINWALRAYIQIPQWIEGTYYESKMKRLKALKQKIEEEGLEDLIVWMTAAIIHTHGTQTIQQCVGYLANYMPHENPFDRARTASELLGLLSKESGLGALYAIQRNGQGIPATIYVHKWETIDKRLLNSFDWINDTCFNPPMVEQPLEVKDNHHCGYKTIAEPLILGTLTQHEEKQNYLTINTLNQIQWLLDPEVMAEPEMPAKPLETAEQHQNFAAMVQASKFVYRLLDGKPFWLCWQYDSRGRIYSHGYHVNFQSAESKKAMLSFNRFETLT